MDKSKMIEEKTEEINERINRIRRGFSVKELAALDNYISGDNPYDAWCNAGLVGSNADARKLIRSGLAQSYIDEMNRLTAVRSTMTLEAIDQSLSDIAMGDIAGVVEIGDPYFNENGDRIQHIIVKDVGDMTATQRACIKSIKSGKNGCIELEMYDKIKALELLAKRRQGFTEKREVELTAKAEVVTFAGFNGRGHANK